MEPGPMPTLTTQTALSPQDWKTWLTRQGAFAVFLGGLAWFVGYYMVLPMSQSQQRYVDALIKTQDRYVSSFEQLVTSHMQATEELKGIKVAQENSTKAQESTNLRLDSLIKTQEQIRDDQRTGAWLRQKKYPMAESPP